MVDVRTQILIDELTLDPLARGYSTMTNVQVARSLNARDRSIVADARNAKYSLIFDIHKEGTGTDTVGIPIVARLKKLLTLPLGTGTNLYGETPNFNYTLARQASAEAVLKFIESDIESADFSDLIFSNSLTDLVNSHVMSQQDMDRIVRMSKNKISRGQEIGYGRVKAFNVKEARRFIV